MDEAEWIDKANGLVQQAVRDLMDGFMDDPYEHRVEHSLHIKLYDLLTANEHLNGWHLIGDGTFRTRLVQKEWPGQKPVVYPDGRKRRQTFDLGILSPYQLAKSTRQEFAVGGFDPAIAVELGLDYGVDHLKADLCKLDVNNIQHRYIVHFSRKRSRQAKAVEQRLEREGIANWVFVHLDADSHSMRYRDVETGEIIDGTYEPASKR